MPDAAYDPDDPGHFLLFDSEDVDRVAEWEADDERLVSVGAMVAGRFHVKLVGHEAAVRYLIHIADKGFRVDCEEHR